MVIELDIRDAWVWWDCIALAYECTVQKDIKSRQYSTSEQDHLQPSDQCTRDQRLSAASLGNNETNGGGPDPHFLHSISTNSARCDKASQISTYAHPLLSLCRLLNLSASICNKGRTGQHQSRSSEAPYQ